MKLFDSQSSLGYRLNLWSAFWPEPIQWVARVAIIVTVSVGIVILSPLAGFGLLQPRITKGP